MTHNKTLKDARGRELPYGEVWEIAYDNALNSGEGSGPALRNYIDNLEDEELLQWATDENGNFSFEYDEITQDELVERIGKILAEMDGKELADLYNREFGEGMTYLGDGLFSQEESDD